MGKFSNYYTYVNGEAESLFDEYSEDLKSELGSGKVDMYDYFDQKVHEWADNDFIYVDLRDVADIIESSDNVETDSGLWEGEEPIDAIQTQAFFTYRNDLMSEVKEYVESFLKDLEQEVTTEVDKLEVTIERLEGQIEEVDAQMREVEDSDSEEYAELEDHWEYLEKEKEEFQEELEEKEQYLENITDTIENM